MHNTKVFATLFALFIGLTLLATPQSSAAQSTVPPSTPATGEVDGLTGINWQLVEIQYMDDSVGTPADPSQYTLLLNADGTALALFDCNRGRGTYEVDGSQISFGPIATTMMACPPPSLGNELAQGLADATSYVLEEGDLFIAFGPDAGILHFTPENTMPPGTALLPEDSTDSTGESASPFSYEALANMTYLYEFSDDGTVTLEDGEFVHMDPEEGSYRVILTGYVAYGDVTGDGAEDAVVVLIDDPDGSGVFYNLAVVVDDAGTLTNIATTDLGDRIGINDMYIEDGQIIMDMIIPGPSDAACCPTLEVQSVYALEDGELVLVSQEETAEEVAGTFSPDGDATNATLELGGDGFWLDPAMVSIHSGAVTEPTVDASLQGIGCAGTIDERPDVVLNWDGDDRVETLRIFLLTLGDPTMVVVTPDGDIVCNDDFNPLVLDPYLEFDNPVPGRYAIYAGSFEENITTPGFLVVTGLDFSPATMDLAQLFPRTANPDAVGEPLPLDVLEIDGEPVVETPDEPLTLDQTPYTAELVAGGDLGAYNIELGNELCTGFIDAVPTFTFDWAEGDAGAAEKLVLFFEGDADTTLLVRNPNEDFQCNDDADGSNNLNPYLDLTPIPGSYQVWVGSFAPSTGITGTLTIAGTTDLQPAALPSSGQ